MASKTNILLVIIKIFYLFAGLYIVATSYGLNTDLITIYLNFMGWLLIIIQIMVVLGALLICFKKEYQSIAIIDLQSIVSETMIALVMVLTNNPAFYLYSFFVMMYWSIALILYPYVNRKT